MVVKFKKLTPEARCPEQAYSGDFCYDLYATSVEEVFPGIFKYGTGLSLEIERSEISTGKIYQQDFMPILGESYECGESCYDNIIPIDDLKIGFDIRPRSSIYKTGLILCNAPGTIDEKYRGEICCMFRHVSKDMPIYQVGDKIAQLNIIMTTPIKFVEVEKLNDEENGRGEKGFGSSGN